MRRLIWLIVAFVAVGFGGTLVWLGEQRPAATSSGVADIGGPFHLVDQRGRVFTDKNLLGKPSLIFFGFTYCPEVCPTTLTHMSAWMKTLGSDADKLNVVFVTIDPERDTPAQLAQYLSAFDPRIHALTGTPAEIEKTASEYRIYRKKIPLSGGGYTMDHSAVIYAFDRRGQLSSVLSYVDPDDKALAAIRKLIAS